MQETVTNTGHDPCPWSQEETRTKVEPNENRDTKGQRTSAISSSLAFFISVSFFNIPRKSVIPYSAQMCS